MAVFKKGYPPPPWWPGTVPTLPAVAHWSTVKGTMQIGRHGCPGVIQECLLQAGTSQTSVAQETGGGLEGWQPKGGEGTAALEETAAQVPVAPAGCLAGAALLEEQPFCNLLGQMPVPSIAPSCLCPPLTTGSHGMPQARSPLLGRSHWRTRGSGTGPGGASGWWQLPPPHPWE